MGDRGGRERGDVWGHCEAEKEEARRAADRGLKAKHCIWEHVAKRFCARWETHLGGTRL